MRDPGTEGKRDEQQGSSMEGNDEVKSDDKGKAGDDIRINSTSGRR